MKIFVECTNLYEQPIHQSGIPRVVRNIVGSLSKIGDLADAMPVIIRKDKVYEIKKMPVIKGGHYFFSLLQTRFIQIKNRSYWFRLRLNHYWPFRKSVRLRRALFFFSRMVDGFLGLPVTLAFGIRRLFDPEPHLVELAAESGDVLILLDATWIADLYQTIEKLKSKGVIIVAVVYDLIPLTHPQFFKERLVDLFNNWLVWVIQTADGFMAISKTILYQLEHTVVKSVQKNSLSQQWYDYFYLGTELDLAKKFGSIESNVKAPFHEGFPVYLVVSTIEPRKNHHYLLDAFELLWNAGFNLILLIAGKVGWKCEGIMKRIQNHSEINRRLFMFNNLDDTELEYCYHNSRCLLSPSYLEGFGLPIVEAMQRGLPVMGSDISVFHEVGGDFMAYFDPKKPETLAALVRRFEESNKFPALKELSQWSWLTWEDSARQLVSKVLSRVQLLRVEPEAIPDFNMTKVK
ncbi:MAG: glycosyltransferase family 1 protein [Desulfobacteraceae bacterium]|nr:glycosyltransferase family 1 protein [Desulfobacteraceae bacterium]